MKTTFKKSLLVSATCLAGGATALFAVNPAFAQTSAPQDAQTSEADSAPETSIVVTGSRIARPDLTSNSPISILSADQIRDEGAINVENVLNQLPSIQPGLNSTVNNGGDGTVTVDIRGLGPSRTLVLVNGRRVVPSTAVGVVDVNTINPQLIERVDVVTGGASATYGSDALGGVVNFIMKQNYQGVEVTGQYGITSRGDSAGFNVGAIMGGNFADDRGNVVIATSWTDRDASFQSQRSFAAIDQNGGSGTGVAGRFDAIAVNPFATSPTTARAFNQDGTTRNFVNSLSGDRFNFAPVNYLQTPQKRFTVSGMGHYDVTDGITAYLEGNYVNSRVNLQLAPTPATGIFVNPLSPVLSPNARALLAARTDNDARTGSTTDGLVIDPATGRAVPAALASAVFRRRMLEVGARVQNYDFNVYQVTPGVRGDITDNWKFDIYYSYGHVGQTAGIQNDVSRQRLTAGLNGCPAGSPTGCVVVNAFGAGNISPAAVNFVRIASAVDTFTFDRDNVVGSITGDLFDLGAGPVGVAFGAEYRKDKSSTIPSDSSQRGDITGFNASQPIKGQFDVKEVFAEASVPILADRPFFQNLTLDFAARYSDYSSVGGVWTYRAGGEYSPFEGLRFRGLYNRASRAPSVFELFQAGDQNFPQVTDPCTQRSPSNGVRAVPTAAVATICQIQGLPDPRTNVLTQINAQNEARNVGNVNLREETSDTYTAGVVFSPTGLRGFTASVDYFDIKVDGYISRVFGGAQGLTDACFTSGVTTAAQYNANAACSLITRTPTGELFQTLPLTNQSTPGINNVLKTRGLDFAISYGLGVGQLFGEESRVRLSSNATYLLKYNYNGNKIEGRSDGDFGTFPKFKANTRLGIDGGPISLAVNWQYIGKVNDDTGNGKIGDENYFDVSMRFRAGDNFEFFGGVNNILDNDPPLINSGISAANYDPAVYDALGRRFFVGATVRF